MHTMNTLRHQSHTTTHRRHTTNNDNKQSIKRNHHRLTTTWFYFRPFLRFFLFSWGYVTELLTVACTTATTQCVDGFFPREYVVRYVKSNNFNYDDKLVLYCTVLYIPRQNPTNPKIHNVCFVALRWVVCSTKQQRRR